MVKRIILLLLMTATAWADTYTPNIGLRLPATGVVDTTYSWGAKLNDNTKRLDYFLFTPIVPTTLSITDTASAGVSSFTTRADHRHGFTTAFISPLLGDLVKSIQLGNLIPSTGPITFIAGSGMTITTGPVGGATTCGSSFTFALNMTTAGLASTLQVADATTSLAGLTTYYIGAATSTLWGLTTAYIYTTTSPISAQIALATSGVMASVTNYVALATTTLWGNTTSQLYSSTSTLWGNTTSCLYLATTTLTGQTTSQLFVATQTLWGQTTSYVYSATNTFSGGTGTKMFTVTIASVSGFGADFEGTDEAPFQAAADYLKTLSPVPGGSVRVRAGDYWFASEVGTSSNTLWIADPGVRIHANQAFDGVAQSSQAANVSFENFEFYSASGSVTCFDISHYLDWTFRSCSFYRTSYGFLTRVGDGNPKPNGMTFWNCRFFDDPLHVINKGGNPIFFFTTSGLILKDSFLYTAADDAVQIGAGGQVAVDCAITGNKFYVSKATTCLTSGDRFISVYDSTNTQISGNLYVSTSQLTTGVYMVKSLGAKLDNNIFRLYDSTGITIGANCVNTTTQGNDFFSFSTAPGCAYFDSGTHSLFRNNRGTTGYYLPDSELP
jgi:hypothetical protein